LKKVSHISVKKDLFINFFVHIKQNVDDFFINRLEPLNNNIKHVDFYLKKSNLSKLNILRFGSILHKLNLESISAMIHQFVSINNLDDYDIEDQKQEYEFDSYKLRISRFFLLIYWELILPVNHFFFCIALIVSFRIYIVFCFFSFLIHCILFLLLYVLRFIIYILVIIFFGKEK